MSYVAHTQIPLQSRFKSFIYKGVYLIYLMKGKIIKVSAENHQRMMELGTKGESFNTIVTNLLDAYEGN